MRTSTSTVTVTHLLFLWHNTSWPKPLPSDCQCSEREEGVFALDVLCHKNSRCFVVTFMVTAAGHVLMPHGHLLKIPLADNVDSTFGEVSRAGRTVERRALLGPEMKTFEDLHGPEHVEICTQQNMKTWVQSVRSSP